MDKVKNNIVSDILSSKDTPADEQDETEEQKTQEGQEEQGNNKNEQTTNLDIDMDDEQGEEFYEYKFATSIEARIKAIENKYYNGLKNENTHHSWGLKIAIWMRDIKKWDRDTAEEKIIEWTINNSKYIKKEKNAIYDAKKIIKSIYDSPNKMKYNLENGLVARTIRFYQNEIKMVKKVQKQAKKEMGAKTNSPSLLYFTFICLSKYFNKNPFFISREDLKIYSKLANETFIKWVNWLKEKDRDYIKVVHIGNSYQKLANEYYVPLLDRVHERGSDSNAIMIDLGSDDELNIIDLYKFVIK
jgi:hypothetical protein